MSDEKTIKVVIGRTNGPITDVEVSADFVKEDTDIELMKDILAMVNKVSENKEKWYIWVDGERQITPVTK